MSKKRTAPARTAKERAKERHRHAWVYISRTVGWQCRECWRIEQGPAHTDPDAAARLKEKRK